MDGQTEFLEKLAKAYQTYDATVVENELAEDMHYSSLWVFQELTSKDEYIDYLRGKLNTMKQKRTTFEFKIVGGRMHSKALLIHKIDGQEDNEAGFVVDFDEDGKVKMINITAPSFF